jgi:putative hydrolases of HD superfamily
MIRLQIMERFNEFQKFMGHVGKLKQIERSGWVRSGIQNPESVADHSFRVTFMALVLADKAKVDQNKAIRMALIHDLAESLVGDLTPMDKVTSEEKSRLEEEAFTKICSDVDNGSELVRLFKEYETGETAEAQFVKRLDKMEIMFQAHEYGKSQPHINLRQFWNYIRGFDFGDLKEIYDDLEASHHTH